MTTVDRLRNLIEETESARPGWKSLVAADQLAIAAVNALPALLDVVEAAQTVASPKVMGGGHYHETVGNYCGECLRTWPCEVSRLAAALAALEDVPS